MRSIFIHRLFWTAALLLTSSLGAGGSGARECLYAFKTSTLEGQPADPSRFAGKVTLAVNVASHCGFTPQYAASRNRTRNSAAGASPCSGFPSNDFGGEEPGSSEEIATFCKNNHGVTVAGFAKLVTRGGPTSRQSTRSLGGAASSLLGTSRSTWWEGTER